MGIPWLVHQTWKRPMDPDRVEFWSTWSDQPDVEYRFYDDAACEAFVAQYFPQYLEDYLWLRKGAERADLFRYLVVFQWGGIYADIDTKCVTPVREWPMDAETTLLVGYETSGAWQAATPAWVVNQVGLNWPERQIGQFCFAAAPRHPAMQAVIDLVIHNIRTARAWDSTTLTIARASDSFVLGTTGPHAFTRAVTPFLVRDPVGCKALDYDEGFGGCFARSALVRHACHGSWRAPTLATALVRNIPTLVVISLIVVVTGVILAAYFGARSAAAALRSAAAAPPTAVLPPPPLPSAPRAAES